MENQVLDHAIESELESNLGLYDIYGMWHKPWWQHSYFKVAVALLVILLISVLCIKIVQWYKARKKKRKLSAGERALQDLYKIKPADSNTREVGVLFYGEISKILKNYLHERYGYALEKSTDAETIAYLQKIEFNEEIARLITDILNGGQGVKFAGQKTVEHAMKRHFNGGIEIIQRTMSIDT